MATYETTEAQRANQRFIREVMRQPLLSKNQELELAQRWREHGDEAALHELVGAYMRLVISMAARFRNYGLPLGDLVQEGNIGLMQAAARFDPGRDVRFSTYASWWIRSSIQDFILRNWSIVRTGTTAAQKSLFFNLRRLRAMIDGGEPQLSKKGRERIALALHVSEDEVASMAARLASGDRSLNAAVKEEGEESWQDFLEDETPGPEELVATRLDGETRLKWLHNALAGLNERERIIIRERRLAEDAVTLASLGERLGISKERVRQIEHNALQKLRSSLQVQATRAQFAKRSEA